MFIMKQNSKFAVAVVNKQDINTFTHTGLDNIAILAKNGDLSSVALLQRLVDSNIIPEGNY